MFTASSNLEFEAKRNSNRIIQKEISNLFHVKCFEKKFTVKNLCDGNWAEAPPQYKEYENHRPNIEFDPDSD